MSRIINKILSAITAAALLLPAQAAFASQFPDVTDTASYASSVARLASLGIMTGDNKGNFNPDANITRAEVTKVIECTLGYDSVAKTTKGNQFVDVKPTDWFAGYANFAAMKGQIKGVIVGGKKYFKPTSNMTLGEFTTLAIRSLGYTDADVPGTWPMNYISMATDLNLFAGLDTFDANDNIKRSDVAIVVDNLLNANPKSEASKDAPKNLFTTVMPRLGFSLTTGVLTTNTTDPTIPANQVRITPTNGISTLYGINMTNPNDLLKYSGYNVSVFVRKGSIVSLNTGSVPVGNAINVTASSDANSAGLLYYLDSNNVQRSLTINQTATIYVNGVITKDPTAIKNGATIYAVQQQANESGYDYIVATQTLGPFIQTSNVTSDNPAVVGNIGGYLVPGGSSSTSNTVRLTRADGTVGNIIVSGANGQATKLSDIKKNDVLYVSATNDNSLIKIQVVRSSVQGLVTATTTQTSTSTGITPATVTINGAKYNIKVGTNLSFTPGNTYLCLLDNTNSIVGVDGSVTSLSSYNVSTATVGIIEGSQLYNSFGQSYYLTRFRLLDGTANDINTGSNTYDGLRGYLCYYTVSNGVAQVVNFNTIANTPNSVQYPTLNGMINKVLVTPNTKIVNITPNPSNGTYQIQSISYQTWLGIQSSVATGGFIVNPAAPMGDYALLAISVQNLNASSTNYGIVPSTRNGQEFVTTNGTSVTTDVYRGYVNGKPTNLDVQMVGALPMPAQINGYILLNGYTTNSNGIVTGFNMANAVIQAQNDGNDVVYVDSSTTTQGTLGRITFKSLAPAQLIYGIDSSVQVYNVYGGNGNIKLDTLSNVNNSNWAALVQDPSTKNIVMIIINKAD